MRFSSHDFKVVRHGEQHKHLLGARTPCGDVHAIAMATAMEIAKMPTCVKDPAPE